MNKMFLCQATSISPNSSGMNRFSFCLSSNKPLVSSIFWLSSCSPSLWLHWIMFSFIIFLLERLQVKDLDSMLLTIMLIKHYCRVFHKMIGIVRWKNQYNHQKKRRSGMWIVEICAAWIRRTQDILTRSLQAQVLEELTSILLAWIVAQIIHRSKGFACLLGCLRMI